jgi:hypothetical protein
MHGQPNLLQVILALHATCGFARRLYGWQQQAHQNSDNRDHHQKFHQSETIPAGS